MEIGDTKHQYLQLNLPGGIVSVGDLSLILEILEKAEIPDVRFGTRQQLYFSADEAQREVVEHEFGSSEIDFEVDPDVHPNIVSSYVAEDLFTTASWLREGVYKDILDTFNYKPSLKIDLVDESQMLIPFFSGNLNFISSSMGNYWHLYIRFPKTNTIYNWSSLIYSEDIARLSEVIEQIILPMLNEEGQVSIDGLQLEMQVKTQDHFLFQAPEVALKLGEFLLPYYEGFNKYNDKYWLGVYRRQEVYPVSFLKDLCAACSKSRIGQIYTTPWKSILIKGLEADDRKLWNAMLDKHLINVCHASNELNWQTEDLCEQGLKLKNELIRAFNDADLRTYKLCFAIKMRARSGLSGSVVIRKKEVPIAENQDAVFDILHTADFNPHSRHFFVFAAHVSRLELVPALINLCHSFYQQQTLAAGAVAEAFFETPIESMPVVNELLQCPHCLSIYDESGGDDCCSVCEAPLNEFRMINMETLYR